LLFLSILDNLNLGKPVSDYSVSDNPVSDNPVQKTALGYFRSSLFFYFPSTSPQELLRLARSQNLYRHFHFWLQ